MKIPGAIKTEIDVSNEGSSLKTFNPLFIVSGRERPISLCTLFCTTYTGNVNLRYMKYI